MNLALSSPSHFKAGLLGHHQQMLLSNATQVSVSGVRCTCTQDPVFIPEL